MRDTIGMCLLVVLSRVHPDAPLVVAANRDEFLNRPALPTTVLAPHAPRVLGGRDELAGGTWFAVNEHGVFAGLTNRPTPHRDPAKRSRGELPLALVQHPTAAESVDAFARTFRPIDFSPAWLLVGDRTSLFLVDMTEGDAPAVQALGRGLHVLENRAWHAPSGKVRHVRSAMEGIEAHRGDALRTRLVEVLRDHAVPEGPTADSGVAGFIRPRETEACCVHAGPYGTRSASVLVVADGRAPALWSSDGPPCTTPLIERTALWSTP